MSAKYIQVAHAMRGQIEMGELLHQERLPGENELAAHFKVSRGTIRQALVKLKNDGLVKTWNGSGSYVSYDGQKMDGSLGWHEALSRNGVETRSRVVSLKRVNLEGWGTRFGLGSNEFLAIERVRSTLTGEGISLERSRIPWRPSLQQVLDTGLVNGSLQATLVAHDLKWIRGRETIGIVALNDVDARLLGCGVGESFLSSDRFTFAASGCLVENVKSLLHPSHFQLQHEFGDVR